jgi:hypothetical protein
LRVRTCNSDNSDTATARSRGDRHDGVVQIHGEIVMGALSNSGSTGHLMAGEDRRPESRSRWPIQEGVLAAIDKEVAQSGTDV